MRNRSNSHNCPYYNEKAAVKIKTDLQTKASGLAAEWHPNKNGELLPETAKMQAEQKIFEDTELWEEKTNKAIKENDIVIL